MADQKRGLGRGIDALFQDMNSLEEDKETEARVQELSVDNIRPNPHQPRREFDQVALEELALSIKQSGVLQPIIVRASSIQGYELVAGERRLRASRLAGKETIPAIVREMTEEQMVELSVLENLQREDLTPLEESQAYATMMEKLDLTQEEVGKRLGKSRPHITNSLRLLKLPQEVKDLLQQKRISMGLARTLLGLKNKSLIIPLSKRVVEQDMTVRALEKEVARLNNEQKTEPKEISEKTAKPNYILASEEGLMDKFGTDVAINGRKNGQGKIEIEYTSNEDLMRILDILEINID